MACPWVAFSYRQVVLVSNRWMAKLSGISMKNYQNKTVLNFVQAGRRNLLTLYTVEKREDCATIST
jgi:hypothetical protein